MSALILSAPSALKLPYLLLTFACTNPSMQDCEVYTERFETASQCQVAALENQTIPRDSLDAFLPAKYTDTMVTYCTFSPEESAQPDVLNFIVPRKE